MSSSVSILTGRMKAYTACATQFVKTYSKIGHDQAGRVYLSLNTKLTESLSKENNQKLTFVSDLVNSSAQTIFAVISLYAVAGSGYSRLGIAVLGAFIAKGLPHPTNIPSMEADGTHHSSPFDEPILKSNVSYLTAAAALLAGSFISPKITAFAAGYLCMDYFTQQSVDGDDSVDGSHGAAADGYDADDGSGAGAGGLSKRN